MRRIKFTPPNEENILQDIKNYGGNYCELNENGLFYIHCELNENEF